jgi:hypothetical protein
MSAYFGLRRQSEAATALSHFLTFEKRCRATLATALQYVVILALFFFNASAFAQTSSTNSIRFQPVEIFADTHTNALAAYQLEFTVTSGNAKIVGIEGGAHPAFAEAPFYDPKAIQQERVILAAFSIQPADKLPTGKTRVATIHLQISGSDELKFETKLTTAANSQGKKIAATISATEKRAK